VRRDKNKLLTNSEHFGRYAITPIFLPLVLIAIAVGSYYYLSIHEFFPLWISYIYIALKIFIALVIIIGSAKTIIMPLVTVIIGLLLIFTSQVHNITLISNADAWQIIFLGVFGFVISLLVKW